MRWKTKSFDVEISWSKIIQAFFEKLALAFVRLVDIFRLFPKRLYRFGRYFFNGLVSLPNAKKYWWQSEFDRRNLKNLGWWLLESFLYLLECLGVAEVYETIMDFVKFNTRSLHQWEKDLAKEYFGDSIRYNRVRIDEYSFVGPKQKKICYVSFYTINSWGPMSNSLLLHEMTHVWQYEKMGIVYIVKALRAQVSKMGYNYGGVSALKAYIKSGKPFQAFNLEQQAEIVTDLYLLKNGYTPRWGLGKYPDLKVYESFVKQIQLDDLS